MGPDTKGVSRPAFSEIETKVLEYLADIGRKHGLLVDCDAGKNIIFRTSLDDENAPYKLIGSHVDSVPMGGNYDGLAGVVAALLCLIDIQARGEKLATPVRAIAMRAEESAWFGPCYIASKMLTGTLKEQEYMSRQKSDKRPMLEHMSDIGIDTSLVEAGRPLGDLKSISEYIELHIEQGPLLVERDLPAAVVSGIRGNIRYPCVECIGVAGHSGAVPRAYRHDPVLAMADLLHRLDESWLTVLQKGEDMVMTSGIVSTDPKRHAMSRIPDMIGFSLEVRSQSAETLDQMVELLQQEAAQIARERKVRFEFGDQLRTEPALMDPKIVEGLERAMDRAGLNAFTMPSGGGHDAAVFSNAGIPSGMIFVRNRNGSHNPDEAMEVSDFIAASSVINEYLQGSDD
ncbi:Zn-dependent hydrolase [Qingshengfaniella alkalisoli]|uniref:Zn-dependent hydrolase n=2 Tax=Qingshengfaniella alkalisoli TaxID=2599296 RepID=A0A5B8J7E1_9RHOB|nr:Zn-dependent hydrolase [Qingshengfaniella alkalisoli]